MGCIHPRDKVVSFEDCEMTEIKIEPEPEIIRVSEPESDPAVTLSKLAQDSEEVETETETEWETV